MKALGFLKLLIADILPAIFNTDVLLKEICTKLLLNRKRTQLCPGTFRQQYFYSTEIITFYMSVHSRKLKY